MNALDVIPSECELAAAQIEHEKGCDSDKFMITKYFLRIELNFQSSSTIDS